MESSAHYRRAGWSVVVGDVSSGSSSVVGQSESKPPSLPKPTRWSPQHPERRLRVTDLKGSVPMRSRPIPATSTPRWLKTSFHFSRLSVNRIRSLQDRNGQGGTRTIRLPSSLSRKDARPDGSRGACLVRRQSSFGPRPGRNRLHGSYIDPSAGRNPEPRLQIPVGDGLASVTAIEPVH